MAAELRPGATLAGYRIEGLIARGGMGIVYRATQLSLERSVALKLVAPELSEDEEFRRRFLREVRVAAALDHPHVLPVYEAGEVGGVLYLAMRLVEGESLAHILQREARLDPGRSVLLVTQVAEALEAAHAAGLVHRDVKPANVLVARAGTREHVYLFDFGLARRSVGATELTEAGGFVGSISYAAPEQIRGEPVDARTDLYALGCLMHECLTGKPPFTREHDAAVLWAHVNESPPLPSSTRPELGIAFDGLLERALAKEPGQRFQSSSEFAAALPSDAVPPARRSRSPETNLPKPASSFLGRERELREIGEHLAHEDVRLLTLTGPGGTGKTRLALQAANEATERFPDGVYWVPLAPLRDPALIIPTVAETLDVREEPQRPLTQTLSSVLAEKQALLLLDNVEHLLPEAANELESLVSSAGSRLLVTSRERLQVPGEQLYAVPTLEGRDAVELFLARARALEPEFEGDGVVAELCTRLDNLPLALELAAARTVIFSPEQLIERIAQRLDLLKGTRVSDPRQQTLRATIEWSHDLLTDDERQLFRRLSIFPGGCIYEAAEEVAGADPDTLQSLLDKSLLRRRASELGPRYWMLETIREYAAEQLDAWGESAALQLRYRRYFLALAEQAEPGLWGGQDEASLLVESENENLRAALGTAIADGDGEIALRLATSIYRFWEMRSRYGEARDWLSHALALDSGNADLRAKALMGVGRAARFQCDWNDGIAALEESARSFRELHDLIGISRCLGFLGHAYLFAGDPARAEDVLEENLAVARQTGDVQTIANALYNLAFVYIERHEFVRSREVFEEAGRIHDSLDNKYGLALVAIHLGHVAVLAGDYARATVELEKGLSQAEEMASPMWIFVARRYLAELALVEGRTDEAERLLVSLFSGRREEIAGEEVAHWLNQVAAVAAAKEDAPRAARLWGAADSAFGALGLALLEDDRMLRARFMARVCEAPDELSWRAAWDEGQEMTIAEAIAYALEVSPDAG